MSGPLLVRVDPPADGAWNMAVDDAMADATAADRIPRLRVYRWARPTLSLGYFQTIEQRQAHPASLACDLVRRVSGGGAIVHDHEITYSLSVPIEAGDRRGSGLYRLVHEAWIDVLARQGVACGFADAIAAKNGEIAPAFLCFQRVSAGDVLAGQTKVIGSAQRRVAGALLQHGSVLLSRSPRAPELAGILDVFPLVLLDETRLVDGFIDSLASRMGCRADVGPWRLDPRAVERRVGRFASPWERARTRK